MTATTINSQLSYYKNLNSETIANVKGQAILGALASIPLLINPITGALFGLAFAGVTSYISPLIDRVLNKYFNNSTVETAKKLAIRFFISIGIAALMVSFVGFPISFASAVALCLLMALIPILITIYHAFRAAVLPTEVQPPESFYTSNARIDIIE